ncbi:MAG: hypothetical protein ACTSVW_04295 [Candidatus Njordarchaeales archaeon]
MEIKNFRIKGKYKRQKRYYYKIGYVRALDKNKALEKYFSMLGSMGIKRNEVEIIEVAEVSIEEIKNKTLSRIAGLEKPSILVD